MGTEGYLSLYKLDQHTNATINVSAATLRSSFDSRLNYDETGDGAKLTLTPIRLISVTGAYDGLDIKQKFKNNSKDTDDTFSQDKLTTGVIVRPLNGLELTYDYAVKNIKKNTEEFTGYQSTSKLQYRPINYKNFNVNIEISNTRNWGFGFNEIARGLVLQSSGEVLELSVNDRNDSLTLGSLNINIDIPLDDIRYLERLQIRGEGYVKQIEDKVNPENELYITGLLFKTTVLL